MRAYELMVIFDSGLDDLVIDEQVKSVTELIGTRGATVASTDRWGRRRFAYEINKKNEGIYAVITLQAKPETVKELDRQLSLNESVVRTKVTRPDAR